MKNLPENQCRRCGRFHDEAIHLIDPDGLWAVVTNRCECGHEWTMVHTAPANLPSLRTWLLRGCDPASGPVAIVRHSPWHQYRLEGVFPALAFRAS